MSNYHDVLGVLDQVEESATEHEELESQLTQDSDGPRLPNCHRIKPSSVTRQQKFIYCKAETVPRKLERIWKLQEYDAIMKEQMNQGVIERLPQESTGEVKHYIPHKPVIRGQAETTKIRMVYYCPAKLLWISFRLP